MVDPFLKWVGSKRQLRALLRELLPPGARFVEPFLGSGAVFGAVDYPAYLLADSNADLINFYRQLWEGGESFIDFCAVPFTQSRNNADAYYRMRHLFNSATESWTKAAGFLYLNRHGFNGLWRVNSKGAYNVSFGRYKNPYFPRKELLAFHHRLVATQPILCAQSYEATLAQCQPGDVVYCDPPYTPATITASFTSYTADGFGARDHELLVAWARKLQASGITVVISNNDTAYTRCLYESATTLERAQVQRSVAASADSRTKVWELIAVYAAAPFGEGAVGSFSSSIPFSPKASGIMAA